jgi:AP-1 complex subunit gamma-1
VGPSTKPSPAAGTLLDGLLGGGSLTNGAPTHAIPSITAFDKAGVRVLLVFVREPASDATRLSTLITAQVSNASGSSIEQFVLQAAVPKQFQLQMLAPSGLHLPANSVDSLTQPMRIASPPQQPIRMRLRLQYQVDGHDVVEQTEVSNLPPSLWQ